MVDHTQGQPKQKKQPFMSKDLRREMKFPFAKGGGPRGRELDDYEITGTAQRLAHTSTMGV